LGATGRSPPRTRAGSSMTIRIPMMLFINTSGDRHGAA